MRRITLVLNAIDVVLRGLSALEPSAEVDALRGRVEVCSRQAERWRGAPPTVEEGERVMKRVLQLHVEVARLQGPRKPGAK